MSKKELLIIGAGGHANSCTEIIISTKKYKIAGYLDKKKYKNKYDFNVLGDESKILYFKKKYKNYFIGIGQIKNWQKRYYLFNLILSHKLNLPSIVSINSIVAPDVKIGKGTIIMNGVIINSGSIIGDNCIINTGAIIDHDSIIIDHSHIAPGVIINGNVEVGQKCFIGSGTIVNNNIKIKNSQIIKSGSLIRKNV